MQFSNGYLEDVKRIRVQRLATFILVFVTLALASLSGWHIWDNYHQHYQEVEKDDANLARSLSQHAEAAIRDVEALSIGTLDSIQRTGIDHFDRGELHRVFQQQVSAIPSLAGSLVYDNKGNWLVTDKSSIPAGANNADREYFQYHQQHPEDYGLHIGPVLKSRSSDKLIIPVSRRINNPDGSFAGVFLATLRLDYFVDFYNQFQLDGVGTLLLTLRDGTVLVRSPFLDDAIGSSLAKGKIYTDYLNTSSSGAVVVNSIIDGTDKLYSFRMVDHYPLVILVGVSDSSILGPWYFDTLKTVAATGLVIVIMLFLGVTLLKQINYGLKAEEALKKAHAEVNKLAMLDSLTGLSNRRQLDETLPLEIRRAKRMGVPLGVIMIDIDHFKKYNDLYGHVAGDDCLKRVAEVVLSKIKRPGDLAVRYGGEEMTVLLPGADDVDTYRVADSILNGVRELQEPHRASDSGIVTISLGIYVFNPLNKELHEQAILGAADESLYAAKLLGRDRVCPALTVLGSVGQAAQVASYRG